MTHAEMTKTVQALIDEYMGAGEYAHLNGADGLRRRTDKELTEYRLRLKAFFDSHDIPVDIEGRFNDSGVGESFYMAHGHSILDELPAEATA